MLKRIHGEKISKNLTKIVKGGHSREIVITDNENKVLLRFPLLSFAIITAIMPLAVGVLIFFFLLSEHHIIIENTKS